MKRLIQCLCLVLLAASLLAQQPAPAKPAPAPAQPGQEDPNAEYRTRESRVRVAERLDSPERAERMRARDLVALLKLQPGDNVADIGTGTGMLVPLLSQAVGPNGRVYAEDIFPDFLEKVREKIAQGGLSNVTPVLGTEKNPLLPRGHLTAVVVVDAYHHFEHAAEMLAGIREALQPSGRLVVVDIFKDQGPRPGHVKKDRDEVVREIEQNGFKLESSTRFTERQYMVTFRRPAATP